MVMAPLATKGNYFHIYDFRVKPGTGDEFLRRFEEFDYSDENPMHKSPAQVKDGVMLQDVEDADHFYLIAEWSDIDVLITTIEADPAAIAEIESMGTTVLRA